MRTECIRRGRRASCGLLWFGGIRGPVSELAWVMVREKGVTCVWRGCGALQVRLHGAVLLVEERHVWHEVLDDVHVGQRVDARLLCRVGGNTAQAGQRVHAIDIHRATPANALPTTPPERQGRVNLVLDADQRVQHHGARLVQV